MRNLFSGSSLCVVGNINRDVKLLGVPASQRLLKDGETSVANVIETVGGGGANSACAAAALGARVQTRWALNWKKHCNGTESKLI